MKYLFMILFLMLTACSDDNKKEKVTGPLDDVSGFYVGNNGFLNEIPVTGINVKDNWFSIDVHWVLSNLEVVKCKYSFFERLDNDVYFVTIPNLDNDMNVLNFSLDEEGLINIKSLGELNSSDQCSSFSLSSEYKKILPDEENRVQIIPIN